MSTLYQVIVIGSGPAACSAALYAARANLSVLMVEGLTNPGGQLITTSTVENYLGLDEMGGFEMTQKFREHAQHYGTTCLSEDVVTVHTDSRPFQVVTSEGGQYEAETLIVATGASARRLGLPSESVFWNNGISGCAVCDGALPMFRHKPLAVVGGGDTALEEAQFLSKFGSVVYLIHRRDTFRASSIMVKRAQANPKIQFILDTVVHDAGGSEDVVDHITLQHVRTGEFQRLSVSGLFYGIGHLPNTAFLREGRGPRVAVDPDGYILTGQGHYPTGTNIPGIFAAGDVQDKRYRQAITSAGTGCMAALDCNEFLTSHSNPVSQEPIGDASQAGRANLI